MKRLSRAAVVALLKEKQGDRTQLEFSKEVGVSPAYISEIYRGTREPGEKILNWLKLKRLVEFQSNR